MRGHTAEKRRLNEWARENYGLTYRDLASLVILVVGFRLHHGLPIVAAAVDDVLRATEGLSESYLCRLERRGYLRRIGKFGENGNQPGFIPTRLALSKFAPLDPPIARCDAVADELEQSA